LILEYIPGQTLAERIAKKPLKLEEALSIALQIAEAVAAAHEHDVIHRDLKPGNIKITPEGKVKVLDFGLAKAVGGEGLDQQSTVTEPGRVVGTPAYMSPEQARGKLADKRSDIWSFGCVLYEMLTGKVPFKGETISDTLANILQTDANWQVLPESTPANIRSLLRHCLKKDPHRRLQHIGDADIEISETLSSLTVSVETVEKMRPVGLRRLLVVGLACLMVGSILTGVFIWSITRPKPTAPAVPMRFDIGLPEGTNLPRGVGTNIAVRRECVRKATVPSAHERTRIHTDSGHRGRHDPVLLSRWGLGSVRRRPRDQEGVAIGRRALPAVRFRRRGILGRRWEHHLRFGRLAVADSRHRRRTGACGQANARARSVLAGPPGYASRQ
ncbi:MAG: protein kinase domain-containing protein, partial [Planctomycetota bacterium]